MENSRFKFRAWDKVNSKMLYGNNGLFMYVCCGVLGWNTGNDHEVLTDQSQYQLIQYTGLKDKNGKEIYEGDVVNVDNSEPEENGEYDVVTICRWDEGCFILEDNAGGHWTRQLFHKPHRLTVIGNIYENPELLK
jgi:uncharacterized phage protein (TIGR01671 family)